MATVLEQLQQIKLNLLTQIAAATSDSTAFGAKPNNDKGSDHQGWLAERRALLADIQKHIDQESLNASGSEATVVSVEVIAET